MTLSSSYSANEDLTTPLVGSTCDANHTYALVGYSTGNTMAEAMAAASSTTIPTFTNLQGDKYIIVRNTKCNVVTPTTGQISGMKFNDLNRNGVKDANEPGLKGWVIRLLMNNPNKKKDTLVATATTDASGNYSFMNLPAGTYDVRETHQKGWKRISKNPMDMVIVAGSVVTDVNFGNAQKQKKENEDNDDDDNRRDRDGFYYAHMGKSSYEHESDKSSHRNR